MTVTKCAENPTKDTTDEHESIHDWKVNSSLFHTSVYQIKVIIISILPLSTKTLPTLFGYVPVSVSERDRKRERERECVCECGCV